MTVDTVRDDKHIDAFGIKCQPMDKPFNVSKVGINTTHCILKPGFKTTKHSHREAEQFFILKGKGEITAGDETTQICQGQMVHIRPFDDHVIHNTSSSEDLVLLSSYTDFATVPEQKPYQVVIAAPPTPNGDLHLGHLGGPYIASDIYSRYLQQRGLATISLSGTDDHQSYVSGPAEAKRNRDKISKTLNMANIEYSDFIEPHNDESYQFFIKNFLNRLIKENKLEQKVAPVFFIKETNQLVRESQIAGGCPSCKNEMVGNCCEDCGLVTDVSSLIKPYHLEGRPIEVRNLSRLFLNLNKYENKIRKFIKNSSYREELTLLADTVFKSSHLYPVSYPSKWGIPIEKDEFQGQVINVWVEMAASYLYISKKSGRDFFNGPRSSAKLFCGKDNAFYYAILLPTLLGIYDEKLFQPYDLFINEFWNLDGKKISTSRNHAIWGKDYLDQYSCDELRYYVSLKRPVTKKENLTLKGIESTLRAMNIKKLKGLIIRLNKILPEVECSAEFSKGLIIDSNDYLIEYEKNFSDVRFGLKKNARLLSDMISQAEDIIDKNDFVFFMRVLGTLLSPFMPKSGEKILGKFHINSGRSWITDLSAEAVREEIKDLKNKNLGRVP